MRALIGLIPIFLVLYGTFWLGRFTGRAKELPTRNPLPVIQAARQVVVAEQLDPASRDVAVQHLEMALDEWDVRPLE